MNGGGIILSSADNVKLRTSSAFSTVRPDDVPRSRRRRRLSVQLCDDKPDNLQVLIPGSGIRGNIPAGTEKSVIAAKNLSGETVVGQNSHFRRRQRTMSSGNGSMYAHRQRKFEQPLHSAASRRYKHKVTALPSQQHPDPESGREGRGWLLRRPFRLHRASVAHSKAACVPDPSRPPASGWNNSCGRLR